MNHYDEGMVGNIRVFLPGQINMKFDQKKQGVHKF